MKLYFLRHADALNGMDDELRPLSSRGKHEAEVIGKFLKKAGVQFDAVYSSPLLRAQETGEIVLQCCNDSKVTLESDNVLRNETPQDVFDAWLRNLKGEHILLVGHAPTMAARVQKLLNIENSETFSLPKGGLACLKISGKDIHFKFLVSPSLLEGK